MGWEALRDGREALLVGREWSKGISGGPVVVVRPSKRAGSGWEALPEGWEWSRGPPGGPGVVRRPFAGPGVVRRPSWRVGSGPIQFQRIGRHPRRVGRYSGRFGSPCRMPGSGRKSLLAGRQWS